MASQDVIVTAWDICTNTLITNLEAIGPKYTERLNDAGPFSFSLDLTDSTTSNQTSRILALGGEPFKVIFSDTSRNIGFTGIARTSRLSPGSPMVDITGTMLTGYFINVFAAASYTSLISPAILMAEVINDLQAVPGANIHITPRLRMAAPPEPFTPSYNIGQHIHLSQIMSELTMGIKPGYGGVDYYMQSDYKPDGTPEHFLNICAPRCGQSKDVSGLSVDLSRIIDWGYSSDNSMTANQVTVVGSGTGASQPTVIIASPQLIGGLGQPPLMQGLFMYNRITSPSHLNAVANGAVQMYGTAVAVYTAVIPVDYEPCALGAFGIGDDVLLKSPITPQKPAGLSEWWRIVAYEVNYPPEGVPSVTLTLNPPPVF